MWNPIVRVDLLCTSYPQGTNTTLAGPMSFLTPGKDERWMKIHLRIIDCTLALFKLTQSTEI